MVILYILLFFLILGLVVCIHELGHFFFAKKAGILVNEFAFGMGPKLASKKKGETTWSLRAFPIGGFCAMSGETQDMLPIKKGDKVRLVLDKDSKVSKIVLDLDNEKYKDAILVEISDFDLFGKDKSPLFLNEYEVLRNALIVYRKNEEAQIAPEERNFFSKTVWQRFLVCLGGPLNNIILALILFIILGFIQGVGNTNTNALGKVESGSPAYIAGLREGDKIIKVGDTNISSFNDLGDAIKSEGRTFNITYIRDEKEEIVTVTAQYIFQNLGLVSDESNKDQVAIVCETEAALGGTNKTRAKQDGLMENGDIVTGIDFGTYDTKNKTFTSLIGSIYSISSFDDLVTFSRTYLTNGGYVRVEYNRGGNIFLSEPFEVYSEELLNSQGYSSIYKQIGVVTPVARPFFKCIGSGLEYFASGALTIFNTLKLLFTSKEVGVKDMGGFITILNQTANYAASGFDNLIYWVALLSINLGIVNLLPIPALDGGRILLLLIEGITHKKINPKVESILINGFFILLMALIVYILFQDVFRMIIQLK